MPHGRRRGLQPVGARAGDRRSMMKVLALIALAFAPCAAHPAFDVPTNDTEVTSAASAIVSAIANTTTVSAYHILSAQKQNVAGYNFFLVLAVATGDAWPVWRLGTSCSP